VETSINDLFKLIVQGIGSACKEVHGPAKKGEQHRSVVDASKLRQELSWEPKMSLKEGLARTVQYFKELAG
jgi:UDP-glucose 4-epimerase